ncbi:hypothetical protein PMG11_04890 [Penicillium brasilianum]|uniref:Uncharacterized protein n=1 Tax=Penicillium brasilianum TaxID=104259 RepID=A0A0F7VIK6_PENBI|nr:hypothetical protein PMG11_04890 [Penicillium brasilianum]
MEKRVSCDTSLNMAHQPERQNSDSISTYEETLMVSTPTSRRFHVYNRRRRNDFAIYTADKTPLAYVRCSSFTIGKPDVTYHAGETDQAPVAAVCKFINFSRHCKVGFGDPNDSDIVWEELKRYKLTNHYRIEMTLHAGARKTFVWKRTHSTPIGDDVPSKLSTKNFKFIDEQTEELVAVYVNNGVKSWEKCGKFQINVDYGAKFDVMVLITGLSLLEKERRRERRNS